MMADPISIHGRKILIVDDEESIRVGFEELFKQKGFDVKVTSGSEEACEVVKNFHPEVVIIDYYLSDNFSGVEVCKFIKSKPVFKDTKVVMITGVLTKRQAQEMARFGFDKILMKPIDGPRLLEEIDELLKGPSR